MDLMYEHDFLLFTPTVWSPGIGYQIVGGVPRNIPKPNILKSLSSGGTIL